ncbi:MAG: hypothetical protein RSG07_04195 [Erysipelotrichaceae bacterium]
MNKLLYVDLTKLINKEEVLEKMNGGDYRETYIKLLKEELDELLKDEVIFTMDFNPDNYMEDADYNAIVKYLKKHSNYESGDKREELFTLVKSDKKSNNSSKFVLVITIIALFAGPAIRNMARYNYTHPKEYDIPVNYNNISEDETSITMPEYELGDMVVTKSTVNERIGITFKKLGYEVDDFVLDMQDDGKFLIKDSVGNILIEEPVDGYRIMSGGYIGLNTNTENIILYNVKHHKIIEDWISVKGVSICEGTSKRGNKDNTLLRIKRSDNSVEIVDIDMNVIIKSKYTIDDNVRVRVDGSKFTEEKVG